MKRFFILATAAIVALASCAKTEVVYKDGPQEIAFKALNGVMTKAPVLNTTFPTTQGMDVLAWNGRTGAAYFGPETFTYDNTSAWVGSEKQYWPTTGSLDFVAYTNSGVNYTDDTPARLTYNFTLTDNTQNQDDFMVSKYVKGKESQQAAVSLYFQHTLALVEVNVACTGQDLTVNSVSLSGTTQDGKLTVTYADSDAAVPTFGTGWTGSTVTSATLTKTTDVTLTAGEDATTYADFLVVPENSSNKTLTVTYTLNGNQFTHPINLSSYQNATSWAIGTKYIYNVTIGLNEIKFAPQVVDWAEGTTSVM